MNYGSEETKKEVVEVEAKLIALPIRFIDKRSQQTVYIGNTDVWNLAHNTSNTLHAKLQEPYRSVHRISFVLSTYTS